MAEKLTKADLRDDLAKAEQELQELLARADSLNEWITATKKLCGKLTRSPDQQPLAFVPRRRTKAIELINRVSEVLRDSGKPLHVNAIAAELSKRGYPVVAKNPTATLAVALGRRPEYFTRVGPNTFDLVKKEAKAAG